MTKERRNVSADAHEKPRNERSASPCHLMGRANTFHPLAPRKSGSSADHETHGCQPCLAVGTEGVLKHNATATVTKVPAMIRQGNSITGIHAGFW